MILLAVAAQLLDLVTYNAAHEVNPIVTALGQWAPVAKLLLLVYLVVLAYVLPRVYARRVLLLAVVAGLLGAVSNIA